MFYNFLTFIILITTGFCGMYPYLYWRWFNKPEVKKNILFYIFAFLFNIGIAGTMITIGLYIYNL